MHGINSKEHEIIGISKRINIIPGEEAIGWDGSFIDKGLIIDHVLIEG